MRFTHSVIVLGLATNLEVETMSATATEVEINFSPLAHHYTLEEFGNYPIPRIASITN